MKDKILVTGADGFIGSHLVEKLVSLNFKVKAFVFYNSMNSYGWLNNIDQKILNNIEIISGDIRDYNFLEKNTKNIDVIYHLAALIAIPYSYYSPKSYIDTNIIGTYNILEASKKNNLSKVIITSTSEVYGSAQTIPIAENHSLNAQSPYAATKTAADQLALSFYKSFNLPITILRPFNTYGPRQSARAIIPTIITQLLNNSKILKIGNTKPTRDFTYIEDTVNAFVQLTKYNLFGEIINIGNKFEISISDIIDIFRNDFGYDFKLKIDPNRTRSKKSEVNRLFADNSKAKKLIKWKSEYSGISGFKKGLKKTINWFSDTKNIKNYNSKIYNI
jgi:NAD dependent epimerase/dehydratase